MPRKSGKKVKRKAGRARKTKSKVKSKDVEVCPNCGSPNIEYATTMRESTISIAGFGLPEKYYCKMCGYEGSIILEVPRSKLGKMHFPKKKHVKIDMPGKESVEVLKPVFTTAVLVFFATFVLLLFSGAYFEGAEQEAEYFTVMGERIPLEEVEQPLRGIGSVTIPGVSQEIRFSETPSGQVLVAVVDTSLFSLGTATGIQAVSGFTVALFMIIFFAAFMILMVIHHWKRRLRFM